MELFSIVTTTPIEGLEDRLKESIGKIEDCALTLQAINQERNRVIVLSLGVDFSRRNTLVLRELRAVCRQLIAEALEGYIVHTWESSELCRIIDTDFSYFEQHERRVILEFAQRRVSRTTQSRIKYNLEQFLEQNRTLNVQGFLKFRLQDHGHALRDAVSKAVDQYLSEKEYNEFIGLLRYFVDIQDTKLSLVHIHVTEEGLCRLADDNGHNIHHDYLDSIDEGSMGEVDYDDLLISALITLAPARVIIHSSILAARPETMRTVESVFRERVARCEHCEICKARRVMPVFS